MNNLRQRVSKPLSLGVILITSLSTKANTVFIFLPVCIIPKLVASRVLASSEHTLAKFASLITIVLYCIVTPAILNNIWQLHVEIGSLPSLCISKLSNRVEPGWFERELSQLLDGSSWRMKRQRCDLQSFHLGNGKEAL